MAHIDFSGKDVNTFHTWYLDGDEYIFTEYTANNAIFGDTDSAGFLIEDKVRGESVDDIVLLADTIGELTNKAFPGFCMHAFNCPESRKHSIQTDREVVSDRSLFLSKKRYIMHLVDVEGSRVDKLKIMGVELKKSDTSKAIKDMLRVLVNHILDGHREDDILAAIQEMKKDFKKISPHDIAKPMSVNTLKKCEDSYRMTGSMKGFPYQVRAAMFWNSNCGPNDRRIMPGDKIRLLYIKNKKSKYIAFPVDMITMPEWFNEIIIDYDKEWDNANKKIESYLSSIGLDVAGRKAAIRDKLFGF